MSAQSTAPVRQVPELTRALQASASDPGASAWVSANAGSGKTTVLVRRVLRLLLADVDPARILCLTYTKAAAANMQSRLFGMLADWVRLGQAELSQALALVLDRAPGAAELARDLGCTGGCPRLPVCLRPRGGWAVLGAAGIAQIPP